MKVEIGMVRCTLKMEQLEPVYFDAADVPESQNISPVEIEEHPVLNN